MTMMKPVLLLLPLCLLLSACTPMLERSYTAEAPHVQFSDEAENASILRAESYQGLTSALLHLIGQGNSEGVIHLYQYVSVTGSAESDVDQACLEATQRDPLGAYALDYIKYNVQQTASYYEVTVKLAYVRTPEQLGSVISVTGSSAVAMELPDLLAERPGEVLFRISHFSEEDSGETIRQAVLDSYAETADTEGLPALTDVTVNLYPDSGTQRLAEILLTWENGENGETEENAPSE